MTTQKNKRFNFPGFVFFAIADIAVFVILYLILFESGFIQGLASMKTIISLGLGMICIGSLLIYLTHAVSDSKVRRVLNIGYIPFVSGVLMVTSELLVFDLTNFTGQTLTISDLLMILISMILLLISFAAVYFALRPKTDGTSAARNEIEGLEKAERKLEEAEKRITVLESEIKALRNSLK
ncbi:tropomyosin [Methanimicrococcus sp. OttesenSCG-928-J09]|nr:tropomyosin [Methanimicrococcus sp. OttesenSCG-928-J09]